MLDGKPRSADAKALTSCNVAILHRREVLAVLARNPSAWLGLVEVLCSRLRHTDQHLVEVALLGLPQRLAKTLLRMFEAAHARTPNSTELRLSQYDLANLVGASRETVNKCLHEWQRAGIIRMRETRDQNGESRRARRHGGARASDKRWRRTTREDGKAGRRDAGGSQSPQRRRSMGAQAGGVRGRFDHGRGITNRKSKPCTPKESSMRRLTFLTALVCVCALTAGTLKAGPISQTPMVASQSASEPTAAFAQASIGKPTITGRCDTSECSRGPAAMATVTRNMPASMTKAMRKMPAMMAKAWRFFR